MWMIKTMERFDRWFTLLNESDRACVLAALMVLREKGAGVVQAIRGYAKRLCLYKHERAAYSESRRSDKGFLCF